MRLLPLPLLLLLLPLAISQTPTTPISWKSCPPDNGSSGPTADPYQGSPFFFQDYSGDFGPLLAAQQMNLISGMACVSSSSATPCTFSQSPLFPDGNCYTDPKGKCRAQATAYQTILQSRQCATRNVPMVYNGSTAFPFSFGTINVPIIAFLGTGPTPITPTTLLFIVAGAGQDASDLQSMLTASFGINSDGKTAVFIIPFRGSRTPGGFVSSSDALGGNASVFSCSNGVRSSGGRSPGLVACMSNVSAAFPNWQLGARSSQAALDALYFITTIQQQYPKVKTFVYAQGLGTLVANAMAAAMPTATWPAPAAKATVDGWILDSVLHPSDDASKWLFGTDTVGHMLMANCSAPMCPESINDYFDNDPNSRYPQSAYQATLDTFSLLQKGYCPDAIAAGFTSQIYASLMSFASGQINRGALGWIAAAYTPMLNAAAYRYIRCSASNGDIDFLRSLAQPAPHAPSIFAPNVQGGFDDSFSGLFPLFNVVRNELLDEDFDLATFYDAFIRPLLTTSPFVDLGFNYYGFVKPLSVWPVTNFGDLSGLPDPSLNQMSVFPSKVLLLSGTADPFHTVTSTQKALGDLLSYSVNASLLKQTPVPVSAISVQNAGSFVFFFTAYCINLFMTTSTTDFANCQTNVPINWNFGSGDAWPGMEFYQYFAISPSFTCIGAGCLTGYAGTLPRAYTFGGAPAMQTFLNFNATVSSSSQAVQQELPAIFSTSDARAVEGLTVAGTLFTALALAGCCVLVWGQWRLGKRAGGSLLHQDHLASSRL